MSSSSTSHAQGSLTAAAASSVVAHRPEILIAPSLLACDFAQLGNESVRMLEYGADWLHVDVMDGHFVPNITLGQPIVTSLRKHLTKHQLQSHSASPANSSGFLDCHMMVSDPSKWVKDFATAGANSYTFHIEAIPQESAARKLIEEIRATSMRVAVAIKPDTPVDSVWSIANEVDMVLVMTVEPGFGGQAFNPHQGPKIRALRERLPHTHIQVDGGISVETCKSCVEAGANVLVAGSAIFKAQDPQKYLETLRAVSKNEG